MANSSSADKSLTLKETLDVLLEQCGNVLCGEEPCSTSEAEAARIILNLEKLQCEVDELSLFSKNEDISELPTASIRFMALPAVLGCLKLNVLTGTRLKVLEDALAHFTEFLHRLKSYGVVVKESEAWQYINVVDNGSEQRPRFSDRRTLKIQRYREQKKLLGDIQQAAFAGKVPGDEESQRTLYLTELQLYTLKCLESLDLLLDELPLARMRSKEMSDDTPDPAKRPPPVPSSRPLKPIVLTRDQMQKQVFGMGYPSLPTMTVEEWCDEEIRKGNINLDSTNVNSMPKQPDKRAEVEDAEDTHDEAHRRKQIDWDVYKDDHRRGCGNTYRKG